MIYKYKLPKEFIETTSHFTEFANGGAQVTIQLKDGRMFREVLISNSTAIIAIRGFQDLPFKVEEISKIFQAKEDQNPVNRSGWEFWDKWQ